MTDTSSRPDLKFTSPSESSKTFVEAVRYTLQIKFIDLQTRKSDTHDLKTHFECWEDMKALQAGLEHKCSGHGRGFVFGDPTNGPSACLSNQDLKHKEKGGNMRSNCKNGELTFSLII